MQKITQPGADRQLRVRKNRPRQPLPSQKNLHTRVSQGMRESRKNGTQIGLSKGTTLVTEKSVKCKEIIKKRAIDFGGMLSDSEVMMLCKISRNSYYKYKRELKAENNT